MPDGPERACLAIADVSGYTGYLAGVELDHAQDILADLIGTIVEAMAPFGLSKLEGDAAFAFLPGEEIDGSMLQDTIEGTYFAFRRRLRDITQASSCECNACVRIPDLDLKFVVHHGSIARQQMMGMEELVGSDVILVHRLLKNRVVETTGVDAYALYTQSALEIAGIDGPAQGMLDHHEEIDLVGDVVCSVRDLEGLWQEELARPPHRIRPEMLIREWSWEAPTPPPVTFDHLTSPRLRPLWDRTITSFDESVEDGRRGAGTTNHCMHGKEAVRELILDWHPPHYWLLLGTAASFPGEPHVLLSDEVTALANGGSQVVRRIGFADDDDSDREMLQMVAEEAQRQMMASEAVLQEQLRSVAAARSAEPPPALPESGGRHVSEPVGG